MGLPPLNVKGRECVNRKRTFKLALSGKTVGWQTNFLQMIQPVVRERGEYAKSRERVREMFAEN